MRCVPRARSHVFRPLRSINLVSWAQVHDQGFWGDESARFAKVGANEAPLSARRSSCTREKKKNKKKPFFMRAQPWLFGSFVLSFIGIIASVWIYIAQWLIPSTEHHSLPKSQYPGFVCARVSLRGAGIVISRLASSHSASLSCFRRHSFSLLASSIGFRGPRTSMVSGAVVVDLFRLLASSSVLSLSRPDDGEPLMEFVN